MSKVVRIGMTKQEAKYLLNWCDTIIDTEKTSAEEEIELREYYKGAVKFFKRLRKELKVVK